jgi:uncharacterized protein YukE
LGEILALDPPWEVVQFLQFIGIDWPMINEDTVRELASVVQEFADNLESTHQDATNEMQQLGHAYQAASYEQLMDRWAEMSSTHMTAMLDALHVVVTVLHAFADEIVVQKGIAIGELVALAASFIAAQAAALFTFGLSEVSDLGLDALAEQAIDLLEEQLQQFVMVQVIQVGFKALKPVIAEALDGFVFKAVESSLGVSGSGGGAGSGFQVDTAAMRAHAAVLHTHAATARQHAATFKAKVAGMSFQ